MSDAPKVEVIIGKMSGKHHVFIDGEDVTNAIGLPFRVELDRQGEPTVTVNLFQATTKVEVGGERLRFDATTTAVLRAAGWTPPKDENGCESPQCQCPSPRAITEIVNDALKSFRPVVRVSGREFYGEIKRAEATRGGR